MKQDFEVEVLGYWMDGCPKILPNIFSDSHMVYVRTMMYPIKGSLSLKESFTNLGNTTTYTVDGRTKIPKFRGDKISNKNHLRHQFAPT